ncbi:MAG: Do family serine endopeptidase [Candidatus Omnitrophica bacterium]|nr:Do family serine endopeptidase [Candidatus Omnitrophota bacterium]MBD3268749.1 Do family serine endopeptidase [Candidatus Omnitrophota bacterium]
MRVQRLALITLVSLWITFFLTMPSFAGSVTEDIPEYYSALEDQTIKVADVVGKAVVSISVEATEEVRRSERFPFPRQFEDDFFGMFFEDFFRDIPRRYQYKRQGLGSGVIINEEGYILTNEHVIADADEIKVKLFDGREFDAEVKGQDIRSDLAVIKINAEDLPVARLGSSEDLRIGQTVVAIGNPFSFAIEGSQPTVTTGVVSALHRALPSFETGGRSYTDLIQTDAAINPGNSGGPLVNLNGEVAGINVALITTTGGYQGLGFAISIDKAKKILQKLIKGEEILYGWLGVSVQDLNENLRDYFDIEEKGGVIIVQVFEDSPARAAGLKEGDLIIAVDGKQVERVRELVDTISGKEPGTIATLTILRDRRSMEVRVELGERPDDVRKFYGEEEEFSFRGMKVEDLTYQFRRMYRIETEKGVIITDIEPGSPAEEAGLRVYDIITNVEGREIDNAQEFNKIVEGIKGDCLVKTNRGFFVVKEE